MEQCRFVQESHSAIWSVPRRTRHHFVIILIALVAVATLWSWAESSTLFEMSAKLSSVTLFLVLFSVIACELLALLQWVLERLFSLLKGVSIMLANWLREWYEARQDRMQKQRDDEQEQLERAAEQKGRAKAIAEMRPDEVKHQEDAPPELER